MESSRVAGAPACYTGDFARAEGLAASPAIELNRAVPQDKLDGVGRV